MMVQEMNSSQEEKNWTMKVILSDEDEETTPETTPETSELANEEKFDEVEDIVDILIKNMKLLNNFSPSEYSKFIQQIARIKICFEITNDRKA